jgi:hypothetical protein
VDNLDVQSAHLGYYYVMKRNYDEDYVYNLRKQVIYLERKLFDAYYGLGAVCMIAIILIWM